MRIKTLSPFGDFSDIIHLGNHLEGKRIALFITDSIMAFSTPSLVSHFRQYGANIQVYLTKEAKKYVTEGALKWMSSNPVIIKNLIDQVNEFDAWIIAPATLSTISDIANRKAHSAIPVAFTSFAREPRQDTTSILIVPIVPKTMEKNTVFRKNLRKLESMGVKIVNHSEQANFLNVHTIVVETIRELSSSALKGKHVLVTAGPTPGRVDGVRILTNRFRGRLGIEIADEAYMRGATVRLILGPSGIKAPSYIQTVRIREFKEYHAKVLEILNHNPIEIGIFSAAVADYIPQEVFDGKIPSQSTFDAIQLMQTPKVIKEIRQKFPNLYMVTFKYEEKISREQLEQIAFSRIRQGYQLVIANRGEEMTPEGAYQGIIVNKNGVIAEPTSKKECAVSLLDIFETNWR